MRQKGIILSAQGVAALSGVCDLYTSSTTSSLPDLDGLNIHPPCCMGRCAPFQLEFELYSFKPFKPQPSVRWLSLAWHINSLRHCAGIQKETPGKAKILFVSPPSNPLWFLLFAFFSLHSWCTFRSTSSGSQAAQGQLWNCKSDGTSKYLKSCWEFLRFFCPKPKLFQNLKMSTTHQNL